MLSELLQFLHTRFGRRAFATDAIDDGPFPAARAGQTSFDATRPVVFMHIPKTSGTALASGLAKALRPAAAIVGTDHSLYGSFREFYSLNSGIRRQVYPCPASLPKAAKLISGHFAFSTLSEAYPQAHRVTVLREPVSRLLSHWLFWRRMTDRELRPWGIWADRVRQSRKPIEEFLIEPSLACQLDNVAVRMLLWPHCLISDSRFIDPVDDERLVHEAMARLWAFDFVDIVENAGLAQRLEDWIGRPFERDRRNRTTAIPKRFRSPLHRELTPRTHELLEARSRLDHRLWASVAARCLPDQDISKLRERTMLANVSRYSGLMTG